MIFLARLLNLHSTCQDERFRNGNFLEKFINSCFVSDFVQQKVGLLAKKVRKVCQLHSTCAKDHFWGTYFGEKWCLCIFSELERKLADGPGNIFRQGCQNCILRFQRDFAGQNTFSEKVIGFFLFFFALWVKLFRSLSKTFSAGLSKLRFLRPEEHFWWKNIFG